MCEYRVCCWCGRVRGYLRVVGPGGWPGWLVVRCAVRGQGAWSCGCCGPGIVCVVGAAVSVVIYGWLVVRCAVRGQSTWSCGCCGPGCGPRVAVCTKSSTSNNTVGKFHNIGEIVLQLGTTSRVRKEGSRSRAYKKFKKRSFLRWNFLERGMQDSCTKKIANEVELLGMG